MNKDSIKKEYETYSIDVNRPYKDNSLKPKTASQLDYDIQPDVKNRLDSYSMAIVSQYIPNSTNLMNFQMTCKKAVNLTSLPTNQFNTDAIGPFDNLDSHTIYTNGESAPGEFMREYNHILYGNATSYADYLDCTLYTTCYQADKSVYEDVELASRAIGLDEVAGVNSFSATPRLFKYDLLGCSKQIPMELIQFVMTYLNNFPRRSYAKCTYENYFPEILFVSREDFRFFNNHEKFNLIDLITEILDLGRDHPFIKQYVKKVGNYYVVNGVMIPMKFIKDTGDYQKQLNFIFDKCHLVETSDNEDFSELIFPELHVRKQIRDRVLTNTDVVVMNVELQVKTTLSYFIRAITNKKRVASLEDAKSTCAVLVALPLYLYNKVVVTMTSQLEYLPFGAAIRNTNIILVSFRNSVSTFDSLTNITAEDSTIYSTRILSYKIYQYDFNQSNDIKNQMDSDIDLYDNDGFDVDLLDLKYGMKPEHENSEVIKEIAEKEFNNKKEQFNGFHYGELLDGLKLIRKEVFKKENKFDKNLAENMAKCTSLFSIWG